MKSIKQKFQDFVNWGHTFGDIEKGQYATTPITNYSDSVKQLIKLSAKHIKRNL
jgi:hypothetical protein